MSRTSKTLLQGVSSAEFVDEAVFGRMLRQERRRSERSGEPFLLVLMHVASILPRLKNGAVDHMGSDIYTATRETDIAGWYRDRCTIGVIFTTLNGADRRTIRSAVEGRLYSLFPGIEMDFYFFPEDVESGKNGKSRMPDESHDNPFSLANGNESLTNNKFFAAGKRAIDVMGSLAALTLLSPLLLLIAVLIKMTSPGPVFFRQKRLGRAGTEFTFLKFRSMHQSNDTRVHQEFTRNLIRGNGGSANRVFKIQKDSRVTPVGRLLRASSMDELPQFINVLLGQMSLVGPRPPIPYEVECYKLWHLRRILAAKPGITGIWQVDGRSRTTFDEMVRMDLRYIRDWSLWLDLKILVKTPVVVLTGIGAV